MASNGQVLASPWCPWCRAWSSSWLRSRSSWTARPSLCKSRRSWGWTVETVSDLGRLLQWSFGRTGSLVPPWALPAMWISKIHKLYQSIYFSFVWGGVLDPGDKCYLPGLVWGCSRPCSWGSLVTCPKIRDQQPIDSIVSKDKTPIQNQWECL